MVKLNAGQAHELHPLLCSRWTLLDQILSTSLRPALRTLARLLGCALLVLSHQIDEPSAGGKDAVRSTAAGCKQHRRKHRSGGDPLPSAVWHRATADLFAMQRPE